jgi:hypothetical protein
VNCIDLHLRQGMSNDELGAKRSESLPLSALYFDRNRYPDSISSPAITLRSAPASLIVQQNISSDMDSIPGVNCFDLHLRQGMCNDELAAKQSGSFLPSVLDFHPNRYPDSISSPAIILGSAPASLIVQQNISSDLHSILRPYRPHSRQQM